MNTTLMAGAAETPITQIKDRPKGYAELYVRALVLADDEKRLAIITAELIERSLGGKSSEHPKE